GFFVFFLPFGMMSLKASALTWLVFGCALFLLSAWMLIKTAKRKLEIIDIFSVMFLFFSFWPAREQIHDGQPNFFLLFFISSAFLCFRYKKLFLAGFILGAGVQIRDYLLPIGLFFLLRKDWKPALGFLSGYISLKAIAISLFGWQPEISYWNYMFDLFGRQQHSTISNLSFVSLFLRVGKGGLPLLVLIILGGAVGMAFLLSIIRLNKTKEGRLAGVCGFIAFCLIVSPWVHESHYVIILPAIILSWFSLSERAKNIDYALFIAAYILLGFRYSVNNFPAFQSGILGLLSAGKIAGLLILIVLIVRLNSEIKTRAVAPS
ncbi:MAG: glycosyltransferase family 87 protein, partial [Candidatus Omnitrophota bacterium]